MYKARPRLPQQELELNRVATPHATLSKEVPDMKRTIQVRIFRGELQFVAECLDLPVVTEAPTLDELTSNIQEAISLHLEGENLEELGFAANPTILATMELQAVA
jgi:predicted RNase H-like HicB family nuclease